MVYCSYSALLIYSKTSYPESCDQAEENCMIYLVGS